jgi:hypothetical protein
VTAKVKYPAILAIFVITTSGLAIAPASVWIIGIATISVPKGKAVIRATEKFAT